MMQGIGAPIDFNSFDRGIYSHKSSSHLVVAGIALVASLSAGFWALSQRATPQSEIAAAPAAAPSAQSAFGAQNPYGAIVGLGGRPQSLALSETMRGALDASIAPAAHTPLAAVPVRQDVDEMQMAAAPTESVEEAEVAPLPPRRPVELSVADRGLYEGSLQRMARTSVVPASPADNRSIFDKVFGLGDAAQEARQQQQPKGQALAYAAPDGGTLSDLKSGILGGVSGAAGAAVGPVARYDRYTAVYDISAHTVYLPDGKKLEAHSGLREHLDDPRFVHLRMRGATPPHVYDLSPREALFHGVQALRLTPIGGEGAIFGRAGLLAHTYMLGPNGDSNGCVSFRDYQAFLRAYKNGEIRRLAVVAHL
ncbi:DUF2778 domain-containing protein [Methylocystis sp. B8]|uniref:DUF2778 domain-containing protein n=1 Tax=Methylocystis sp. B8 TaxID=544938 RepID=UPI0010FD66B6|nr:DUF2778 domain-containing protein [Methylocystis sp. B8]TLG78035.1 DUF2778 domain-containing protein [Methylocystis sp. B8]